MGLLKDRYTLNIGPLGSLEFLGRRWTAQDTGPNERLEDRPLGMTGPLIRRGSQWTGVSPKICPCKDGGLGRAV